MALTKYKLGDLIEQTDERNRSSLFTLNDVKGISTEKKFIDTKANMDGVSLDSYKVVNPGEFAYVADTSRRGDKIALAYNETKNAILISSIYSTFRICREDLLLPVYLFMYFNRPEFDRYSRFNSWGSARETFSWDDMCDIEITLPSIETQHKFVDVYISLQVNLENYKSKVDDLKFVCDIKQKNFEKCDYIEIGAFIERNINRNKDRILSVSDVKGFDNDGLFIKPKRLFSGDISTFKIIQRNEFVYNSRVNSTIKKLSIAYNEREDIIVSPAYESFRVIDNSGLYPYYLYMLLQNEDFAQKVLFNSIGSATIFFDIEDLGRIKIPVPSIEEQKRIADVYRCYKENLEIVADLNNISKQMCPILIQGSLQSEK